MLDAAQFAATCPNAVPVEISVTLSLNSAGQVVPEFGGSATNPADITVSRNGDLNFERRPRPILVSMRITNSDWTWLQTNQINVFAFADDAGGVKEIVRRDHHQIRDVTLSEGDRTVTFCYRNSRRGQSGQGNHRRSEYTIYLMHDGQMRAYDPIIRNGGSPVLTED